MLAFLKVRAGETVASKEYALQSIRLSPKDQFFGTAFLALAMAAFVEQDNEAFEGWAEKAIRALHTAPIRRALMIAYAADIGDRNLMETHQDELMRIAPDFIASIFDGRNQQFERPEHVKLLLSGLRKAGLP